ncbi:MAG: NAD-dependent epimerase/dehydratase family protein [Lentisphaerae bacterium]|nr:MAG: NAD-dependent epimerase/dehydratase family protein [Lentisphaerota bacterium]
MGSHLCEELVKLGAHVRAYLRYNALGYAGWLDESPLRDQIEFFWGDIRDAASVAAAMEGCHTVFHLAALISIPYSYQAPEAYIQTNVLGTANVLQAARRFNTPRILVTSTSEVYGTAQYVPIDEKHPLQAQSPYAASKIAADKLCESYHRSFDLPVTIVRPFNTFGPRQSTRAVIPAIITQILAGENPIRLGALTPTRDLNFVANTVNAFITAATHHAAIGQVINFGSGREISIGDLARKILQLMQCEREILCDERRLRPEKSEVNRLLADSTLAAQLLQWQPSVSLEDGLIRTIEWYRDPHNLAMAKPRILRY